MTRGEEVERLRPVTVPLGVTLGEFLLEGIRGEEDLPSLLVVRTTELPPTMPSLLLSLLVAAVAGMALGPWTSSPDEAPKVAVFEEASELAIA